MDVKEIDGVDPLVIIFLTVICAVLASSGFWAYMTNRRDHKDVKTKMLLGLAHDRIISLGMSYIDRGWLTNDEYENLKEYLHKPYKEMGGNGAGDRIMDEVDKLELRQPLYTHENKK